jgi:hypothetical protein
VILKIERRKERSWIKFIDGSDEDWYPMNEEIRIIDVELSYASLLQSWEYILKEKILLLCILIRRSGLLHIVATRSLLLYLRLPRIFVNISYN